MEFGVTGSPSTAELRRDRPALARLRGPAARARHPPRVRWRTPRSAADAPDDRLLDATVDLVERIGADAYLHFVLDAPTVLTDDTRDLIEAAGRDIGRFEEPSGLDDHRVRGAREPAHRGHRARPVRLVVDTSQLQLFDVDTGAGDPHRRDPVGTGRTAHGRARGRP